MPATTKSQFRLFSQVKGVQKWKSSKGKEGLDPKKIDDMWRKQIEDLANKIDPKEVNKMIDVEFGKLKESSEIELELGIAVEMEHTKDPKEAEKIANDHLGEDPNYYSKLYKAGLIDEPDAIKIAKSAFENSASATVGSVNGMGVVSFPGDPGSQSSFVSQKTGSGDIPFTLSKDLPKKKKKKRKNRFKRFDEFVNENLNKN